MHGAGQGAGAGARIFTGQRAKFLDPGLEVSQEQFVGHRDRELAALDRFRPFIGGLELRVHPLVPKESRTIFGDTIATHQTDRLPHHVRAMAGIPEFAGRAIYVGHRITERESDERISLELSQPDLIPPAMQLSLDPQPFEGIFLGLAQRLDLRPVALDPARGKQSLLLLLERIQLVE